MLVFNILPEDAKNWNYWYILHCLAEHFPENLTQCGQIDTECVPDIMRIRVLQKLYMSFCRIESLPESIILSTRVSLQSLDLSGCSQLTDELLITLLKGSDSKRLLITI